ncbi:MAG: YraN family protein [Kiloniellaceae bacterium]
MTAAARRRAYARGRRAERLAAWWLRLKGYRILAQDFRCPVGEIDLVARRGGILAVVEVKRRDRLDSAGEAVSPRQQRRIRRAAELFVQRHPALAGLQPRFDALLLAPGHLPRHLKDAWNADTMLP